MTLDMLYEDNNIESRREAVIRGLILYLGEKIEDLIKDNQVDILYLCQSASLLLLKLKICFSLVYFTYMVMMMLQLSRMPYDICHLYRCGQKSCERRAEASWDSHRGN
ncbi:hypothetical protein XENOCAPTIV_012277 [Xenoophorus captivus]|uniref:Uncharacterized protein n=1 Tax=Xenoophorus captivus TaxID=1517983 RepID=A0ABV0R9N1_9TELE